MPRQTQKRTELEKKRRIYIFAATGSRATDWMESHGFLEPGVWRDPRVTIVQVSDQIAMLQEGSDIHYEFLPDWKKSKSLAFLQQLWNKLPTVMQKAQMRRATI